MTAAGRAIFLIDDQPPQVIRRNVRREIA